MSRESFGEGQWSRVKVNGKFFPETEMSIVMNINHWEIKLQTASYIKCVSLFTHKLSVWLTPSMSVVYSVHLKSKAVLSTVLDWHRVEVLSRGEPADGSSFIYLTVAALAADNLAGRRAAQSSLYGQGGILAGRVQLWKLVSILRNRVGFNFESRESNWVWPDVTLSLSLARRAAQLQPQLQTEAHSWHVPARPWLSRAFACRKITRKSRFLQMFLWCIIFQFPLELPTWKCTSTPDTHGLLANLD